MAWGWRGTPDGSNLSFGYGSNPNHGAMGHWGGPDIGWDGGGDINNADSVPVEKIWHHLVYTYDGSTTAVYVDGDLVNTEFLGNGTVNTKSPAPINRNPPPAIQRPTIARHGFVPRTT